MSYVLQISNRCFLFTLLGILILLIGGKGHSQNLSGRVLNDQGQALDGATILLHEADSTTMRGFSISDSLGNWQINKPDKANLILTAAYLGYATRYIPIDTELLSRDTIVIVLRSSAQLLTEVEVRAKPLRIVVKGDTLSFDAKAFLREGDQTLGDLLGNMPGIEYSKSGEILYNNERIDKLLLEGRDILADQHKLSAEGIQAQDIQAINIIEHYRSFSEQYLPFKSNKVAMDIKLTDEAKFRINGDVELLAGHESKYEAKTNVYRVGEQSGMTSFIRANNIGEAVMSSGDFLSIKGSLYHALKETKGDLSQLIPAGFTPSMDVQQNYDNVILFNLEKDKGKRQKSRITSMVNYAKRNQESTLLQNFEDRNLSLNGIKNKKTIFPYVYSKWTMDKLFENKNGRISFEIPAYADLSKNVQSYDGDISLQASHNFYTNRTKTFNVAPKISFYKSPSKKHSYYWDVDLLLENKDHNLFLSQDGEFQTEINQTNRNQKGKAGLKLGYYRFLENWELNGEVRSSYMLTDWRIESKETPLYDTDFHHSILNFNSNVNFEYEKNKWMAELQLNADYNHHRLDSLQKQNFVYSPSLMLKYSFNQFHFFLLTTSLSKSEVPASLSYNTYEYVDENTIQHGSLPLGTTFTHSSIQLTHLYFSLIKEMNFHTILNYFQSQNGIYQDYTLDNGLLILYYKQAIAQHNFSINNTISWKMAKQKLNFDLTTRLSKSETQLERDRTNHQHSYYQSIGIDFQVTNAFEIGYSYYYQFQKINSQNITGNNVGQGHSVQASHSKNKLQLKGGMTLNLFKGGGIDNHFVDLSASAEYKLANNWTIRLIGRDLLNLNPQVVYSYFQSISYVETLSYRRFPGSVLIGFKKLF